MPPASKAKKTVAVAASSRDSSLPDLKVKKKKPRRKESYGRWIYMVLKQVHPEYGISNRSMSTLDSFVNDIFHRIAREAADLVTINKKKVMSAREMESATKLTIPGELSRHAVSEGYKALQKYASNQKIKF